MIRNVYVCPKCGRIFVFPRHKSKNTFSFINEEKIKSCSECVKFVNSVKEFEENVARRIV